MTTFFSPKKILDRKGNSPTRIYGDGFLYEKLREIIPQREISILDVGCGSGYVRKIFHDLGYKVHYTGVDIKRHKNFEKYDKYTSNTELVISEIEAFNTEKKFDFVISLFALEHIKDDSLAVEKMSKMLLPQGVVLCMVPSKWSFLLYFKHGHRRYDSNRLEELFGRVQLYRIGGAFSYLLHFILVTIMKHALKTTALYRSSGYLKILTAANFLDRFLPIFPVAYVIVKRSEE